mmetsp:Transcript_9059/g.27749  ORF Transcript_9059/g.27749 Transcript_9059/m.27749 type:complete len:222 (+) Transcript_9059:48-713(+)
MSIIASHHSADRPRIMSIVSAMRCGRAVRVWSCTCTCSSWQLPETDGRAKTSALTTSDAQHNGLAQAPGLLGLPEEPAVLSLRQSVMLRAPVSAHIIRAVRQFEVVGGLHGALLQTILIWVVDVEPASPAVNVGVLDHEVVSNSDMLGIPLHLVVRVGVVMVRVGDHHAGRLAAELSHLVPHGFIFRAAGDVVPVDAILDFKPFRRLLGTALREPVCLLQW